MTQTHPMGSELSIRISTNIFKIRKAFKHSSNDEIDELLNHIRLLVDQSTGIEDKDVVELLEVIVNMSPRQGLTGPQRRYLLDYVLIPNKHRLLPISIIYSILAVVGVSKVSSKSHHTLPQTLQLQLLQWMIRFLGCFGENVYQQMNRMLPILFNYLSYEYSRPYIANLIYLTLSNYSNSSKTYFNRTVNMTSTKIKRWHVQSVIDLYYRFPTDEYLINLLLLFKQLDPSLDYGTYNGNIISQVNNLRNSASFAYPSDGLIHGANAFKSVNTSKRRKMNATSSETIDANLSATHIDDIKSIYSLVEDFESIKHINIKSLSAGPGENVQSRLFVLIQRLLDEDSLALRKLDYSSRLTFLDSDCSKAHSLSVIKNIKTLNEYAPNLIFLPVIKEIIAKGEYNAFQFLPSLSPTYVLNFKEEVVVPIFRSIQSKNILQATINIVHLLNRNHYTLTEATYEMRCVFYKNVNDSLLHIFQYLEVSQLTPDTLFAIISVLQYIKTLPLSILDEFFEDSCLVLPPKLVYSMILYGDPCIFSEICGYIAFTKQYQFKSESYKLLQNSYIMDIVNLIWRDKGFSYDGSITSSSKALLLNPTLIPSFSSFPLFASIKPNTIGGIYFNPAWSYICAQIVWKFEDSKSGITTRHHGPVTAESVFNLNNDVDSHWLALPYDELKLNTLNELDRLGFTGICDLLFHSLRTLMQHRQISQH